jgi:hypothetical protein
MSGGLKLARLTGELPDANTLYTPGCSALWLSKVAKLPLASIAAASYRMLESSSLEPPVARSSSLIGFRRPSGTFNARN